MKKKILVGGAIALGLSVILCLIVTKWEIGNYISVIGSIASLYGIWVAYQQIKSVGEIAEKTQTAVNSKLSELNSHLTFADLSRIHSMGKEIQAYMQSSKYEVALVRLRDFKEELVQLKQNEKLFKEDQLSRLNSSVIDLGIDITNLSANYKKKDQISNETIHEHLDDALSLLAEIEGILKYKNYDTGKIQGAN